MTLILCYRLGRSAIFVLKFVSQLAEAQKKYDFYDFKWL